MQDYTLVHPGAIDGDPGASSEAMQWVRVNGRRNCRLDADVCRQPGEPWSGEFLGTAAADAKSRGIVDGAHHQMAPRSISISPNPASGQATVTLTEANFFTLTVIDLSGRVVSRLSGEVGFAAFGEELPAGIYTVLVESDEVTSMELFVKL